MKNIIKSLIVVVAVAAVAGGATYAYFSDPVKITGITMSSGNADLQISSSLNGGYVDDYVVTSSDVSSYGNLYPGQVFPDLNFYLKNNSIANIGLDTYFEVETTNGDKVLCDAIDLKLKRFGGSIETGWHSLCWWRDNFSGNGWNMGDTIPQGVVHGWTASLKVDPNAGNEIQGKNLGLKVTFTGEQHH